MKLSKAWIITLVLVTIGASLKAKAHSPELVLQPNRTLNAKDVESSKAQTYLQLCLEQFQQDNLAKAEVACRNAVQLSPKSYQNHLMLGYILQKQNKLDSALASFRMVVKLNPHSAEGYGGLGLVLLRMEKQSEAIAAFKKAASLNSQYAEVYNNLVLQSQNNKPSPPAETSLGSNALPAGKYKCFSFVHLEYVVGTYGAFVLDGRGGYQNKAYQTSGRYTYNAQQGKVTFFGGEFDGYSAEVKIRDDGKYKLIFRNKDPESETIFKQECVE